MEGTERGLEVGEIHHPAGVFADLAFDRYAHGERVPVQPCTLVPFRHVRQPVRGLERELLEEPHHRMPSALWVCTLRRQRGCARQYATAAFVLASTSGPSMGCRKKWRKSSDS